MSMVITNYLDVKDLAKEIREGRKSWEDLIAETGWEVVEVEEDGVRVEVARAPFWFVTDGEGDILVDRSHTPKEAAETFVFGCDWPEIESTTWHTVVVYEVGISRDGEFVQWGRRRYKIARDPEEPPCLEGEDHDWHSPQWLVGGIKENPGVWLYGGGVWIEEVCMNCGCARYTDTWAQDPEDGEQGLQSVEYDPGKYADPVRRHRISGSSLSGIAKDAWKGDINARAYALLMFGSHPDEIRKTYLEDGAEGLERLAEQSERDVNLLFGEDWRPLLIDQDEDRAYLDHGQKVDADLAREYAEEAQLKQYQPEGESVIVYILEARQAEELLKKQENKEAES